LQEAERYAPAMAGVAKGRPYGAPPGRRLPEESVRYAVATTAVEAARAALEAAEGHDDESARATSEAYGWAVHAAQSVHVAGLDRVLEVDLRFLRQACLTGQVGPTAPVSPDVFALEQELRTYRRELPRLLAEAPGKFALVHGDKVESLWATYEDALQAGYERHQLTPFLVKRISAGEDMG
jgi:hypothetical protein